MFIDRQHIAVDYIITSTHEIVEAAFESKEKIRVRRVDGSDSSVRQDEFVFLNSIDSQTVLVRQPRVA